MLIVTCTERLRNSSDDIVEYILCDSDGKSFSVPPKTLTYLIERGIIYPTNLKIAADGRVLCDEDKRVVQPKNYPKRHRNDNVAVALTDINSRAYKERVRQQQVYLDMRNEIRLLQPRIMRLLQYLQRIRKEDSETWRSNPSFKGNTDKETTPYKLRLEPGYQSICAMADNTTIGSSGLALGITSPNMSAMFYTDGVNINMLGSKEQSSSVLVRFLALFDDYEEAFYTWFSKYYATSI